jgi:hypothetical protein
MSDIRQCGVVINIVIVVADLKSKKIVGHGKQN